ncbi:MAG: hypothetical protein NT080_09825 [Spirochaetes bacterium]|nr:hypothetical protein [Spirochaetota bacterium]
MKARVLALLFAACASVLGALSKSAIVDELIDSLKYLNPDPEKMAYYSTAEGLKELWMLASAETTTYYRVSELKMEYYLQAGSDYSGTLKAIEAAEECLALAEADPGLGPSYRDHIAPAWDSDAAWRRNVSRILKQGELIWIYISLSQLYAGIEEFDKADATLDRLESKLPERLKYRIVQERAWIDFKTVDWDSVQGSLDTVRKAVDSIVVDMRDDDREDRDLFYQSYKYEIYIGLKNIEAMLLHFKFDTGASAALYESTAGEIGREYASRGWTGAEANQALFLGNASYVRLGELDLATVDAHFEKSKNYLNFGHYETRIEALRMRNKADEAAAFIDSIFASDARAARLEFGVGWKLLYRGIVECQDGDFDRGLPDLEAAAKVRETFFSNSYSIVDYKQVCYTELSESFARHARFLGFRYGWRRWLDSLGSWAKSAYYSFLSVVTLPQNHEFRALFAPYFYPRDRSVSFYAMPELVKSLGHGAFAAEMEKLKSLDGRTRIRKYYDLLLALNAVDAGKLTAAESFLASADPFAAGGTFDPGGEAEYASMWAYGKSLVAERRKDDAAYGTAVETMYRYWPQSVPFMGRKISFSFDGVDESSDAFAADAKRVAAAIDVPGVTLSSDAKTGGPGARPDLRLGASIAAPPAGSDGSVLYELRVTVSGRDGPILTRSVSVTDPMRKPGRLEDLVFGAVFGTAKIPKD